MESAINAFLIDYAIGKSEPRPHPFSTMSPYTSWESLTDRTWSGLNLAPDPAFRAGLPPVEKVLELFRRPTGHIKLSPKSTVLFSSFAQWFTDGFLRTDRQDPRRNTSNHDIDLSPLYGLSRRDTEFLRLFQGGKLKSQWINGEEYPPFYFDSEGQVRPEFKKSASHLLPLLVPPGLPRERSAKLFAMGVERANVHVGYVMFNTLFLREHNRICDVLAREYPHWDDERLFQTARNILIVLLMKLVINEYINHIAPYHFEFRLDPPIGGAKRWYRQNWMTVEFDLLYRWHSLVPDTLDLPDRRLPIVETVYNNSILIERGLGPLFDAASRQAAGEVTLGNTHPLLLETEEASIRLGRSAELPGYNAYREANGFPRVTRFEQISSDPEIVGGLRDVYGEVDRIEFYVGLFAEDVRPDSVLPALVGRMVGIDAFSQALTNPLVAENIYNEQTFSPVGLKTINETHCLSDLLHRNIGEKGQRYLVTMTQEGPGTRHRTGPMRGDSPSRSS
ncbi:MAG TPA: peroxidase family protein [Nitriliruptorales bacterium]|nr:peroxidase family protein [Nitriliruptorales bacterium]